MAKNKKEMTPEERLAAALVPEEEQPYELPKGWKWVYWGKCGEFIAGTGFPKAYQGLTDRKYPFYKVGSLRYVDADGCLTDNQHTIDDDVLIKLKAKKVGPHAIVFAKIGEAIRLNRRGLTKQDCCIDNNMMAFQADKDLLSYQYAYFWSLGLDLYKYTNATTVPAIRKTDLEKIIFPLPSLSEQWRIVTHIESMFAKLDAAKEKVQAVLDAHETRKAALLHDAFAGKLTAKWREARGVTGEVYQSMPLVDVCKSIFDGDHMPPPKSSRGIPFVVISNVNKGKLDFSETRFVPQDYYDKLTDTRKPESGDVLYTLVGTYGIPVLVDTDRAFCFQRHMALLKPKEEAVLQRYLWYALQQRNFYQSATKIAKGTAQLTVPIKGLRQLTIPMASLPEQQEIVAILDRLLGREEEVRQSVESVLAAIDSMKQSILAQAFHGELGA